MKIDYNTIKIVIDVILELAIGYVPLRILSYLFLQPGKKKIININDAAEQKKAKAEMRNARIIACFIWTLLVVAFNMYLNLCKGV